MARGYESTRGVERLPKRTTSPLVTVEDVVGLSVVTPAVDGLAPASGGGDVNFLRADGAWAEPASGGVSDGDKGDIVVSGSGATWTFDSSVVTAFARTFLDDADAGTVQSTLGLGSLATQSGTFSGTSSGTNTGDQFTAMTAARFLGRVTAGFGLPEQLTGAQATDLLDTFDQTTKGLVPAPVTISGRFLKDDGTWDTTGGAAPAYGDITGIPTDTFLGRDTAGTGNAEAMSVATAKSLLDLSGTNSGDQTSVTGNAGTATALQTARNINGVAFDGTGNITINAVDSTARVPESRTISTTAPLGGGGALSGNLTLTISAATTGAPGSMSAADKTKLDGIASAATANDTDANLKARANHTGTQAISTILAAAAARLFGRITGGGGAGEELTGTQATTLLDLFTSALKGLVPASGGGTSNFLRADGTWAAPGGGSDPWTTVKLALDFNNALNTFVNVTDGTTVLTFTPPADTDWEMEARIMVWTTATANLPRIGVAVAAGATRGMGGVNLWQAGATATTSVSANGAWSNAAGITVAQIAAGGVLTASVPYICEVIAAGRSGAAPTAISIQMACETGAAATCYVKRGSFLKYRTF